MNRIIIMGRLTRDPEMRTTASGLEVCSFAVAVERSYKNQDGSRTTDFFDCQAWRERGAFVHTYFRKGNRILVEGSIEFRKYTGQDGVERRVCDVKVSSVEFCESKNSRQDEAPPAPTGSESDEQKEDELPF